jgi:hypothetical protein
LPGNWSFRAALRESSLEECKKGAAFRKVFPAGTPDVKNRRRPVEEGAVFFFSKFMFFFDFL